MNSPSSFSSISFDSETAIKFKKLAKDQDKTHTQLLNELMKWFVKSVLAKCLGLSHVKILFIFVKNAR